LGWDEIEDMTMAKARSSARATTPADLPAHVATYRKATAVKAANSFHEQRRLLDERAFYPAHDKRKESPKYAAVHKDLVDAHDLPCLVCGVRKSTLKDRAKNPYGAKALETHHHVIEWALANAIDPARFNAGIRPFLAHRHPDEPTYQRDMSPQEVSDWVDHSPDNLWVVCDVHHRAKYFGIHEISYPIWCPQDLLGQQFLDFAKSQLGSATGAKKNGTAPAKNAKKGAKKVAKKVTKKAKKTARRRAG
jgi:hypothetical protein